MAKRKAKRSHASYVAAAKKAVRTKRKRYGKNLRKG